MWAGLVEIQWPWKAIGEHAGDNPVPPVRGTVMRVDFSRVQYPADYSGLSAGPMQSQSGDWLWSPLGGLYDVHHPEMWGRVVFTDSLSGFEHIDVDMEGWLKLYEPPSPPQLSSQDLDEMVYLPECTLTLGPDPSDGVHSPAHEVKVGAFWMDKYEVTVERFTRFLNSGVSEEFYSGYMADPDYCGILREGSNTPSCSSPMTQPWPMPAGQARNYRPKRNGSAPPGDRREGRTPGDRGPPGSGLLQRRFLVRRVDAGRQLSQRSLP